MGSELTIHTKLEHQDRRRFSSVVGDPQSIDSSSVWLGAREPYCINSEF